MSVVAKVMEENKPNRKRRTSSRSESDKLDVYCRTDSMATSASCGSINLLADDGSDQKSEDSESRRELVEGDSIDALNQEQKEGDNKENGDDDDDDEDNDNDDDENLELIWLEVESPGELKPGFNTVLVRGKVSVASFVFPFEFFPIFFRLKMKDSIIFGGWK